MHGEWSRSMELLKRFKKIVDNAQVQPEVSIFSVTIAPSPESISLTTDPSGDENAVLTEADPAEGKGASEPRYAPVGKRAAALMIDQFLIWMVSFSICVWIAFGVSGFIRLAPEPLVQAFINGWSRAQPHLFGYVITIYVLTFIVSPWLYFSLFESLRGATPGKRLLGMRVCKEDLSNMFYFAASSRFNRYSVELMKPLFLATLPVVLWFYFAPPGAQWIGVWLWAIAIVAHEAHEIWKLHNDPKKQREYDKGFGRVVIENDRKAKASLAEKCLWSIILVTFIASSTNQFLNMDFETRILELSSTGLPANRTGSAVIAAHDLQAGETLKTSDLAVKPLGALRTPRYSIFDPSTIVGKQLLVPIRSGELVQELTCRESALIKEIEENRPATEEEMDRARLSMCNKKLFRDINSNSPDLYGTYNARAWVYNRIAEYEQALTDSDKSIKLKPDYVYAQLNRAYALWKLNRDEDALAEINEALKSNASSSDGYHLRARIYQQQGQEALAGADQKTAATLGALHMPLP